MLKHLFSLKEEHEKLSSTSIKAQNMLNELMIEANT